MAPDSARRTGAAERKPRGRLTRSWRRAGNGADESPAGQTVGAGEAEGPVFVTGGWQRGQQGRNHGRGEGALDGGAEAGEIEAALDLIDDAVDGGGGTGAAGKTRAAANREGEEKFVGGVVGVGVEIDERDAQRVVAVGDRVAAVAVVEGRSSGRARKRARP